MDMKIHIHPIPYVIIEIVVNVMNVVITTLYLQLIMIQQS